MILILLAAAFASVTLANRPGPRQDVTFGVTYSVNYTEEFGMDWQEVYDAILNELGVRHIRLPIYWNQIEPLPVLQPL
mgnify:CR=1 FL=1